MDQVDSSTAPQEALDRAAHALYAVAPVEFVPTRKAWVTHLRSVGLREVATEVAALRKPSVSAAAINALVRAEDPVVSLLVNVGTRLRHAQAALDAAGMAALRGERDQVLTDWVRAARTHAPGEGLTGAVEAEVRSTAVAALADEAAAEVATSGTLTRALSYSGFGEVDVADAVARTSTGVVLTRIEGGLIDEEDGEEEDGEEEDGGQEDDGQGDEDQAGAQASEQEDEEDLEPVEQDADAGADLAALEMDLDEAEKAVAATRAARKDAAAADERAARAVTVAVEQVAQAERLLAGAREHLASASATHQDASAVLAAAEEDLAAARTTRDAARAALEEAEDD